MISHLALLLALTASASGSPAALKPARTFAQGAVDPTFTLIATPTESSVNLWSLATGRQVGHADLPPYERKHEKDSLEVTVHSIRTDLKLILVTMKHWQYNPSWTAFGEKASYWTRADHRVVLASLEDGVPVKTLWSGGGACGSYGIQTFCPGTVWNDGKTRILDDRPEVVIHGLVSASGERDSFRKTETLMAFDLKGRKLFENETGYAGPMTLVRGTEKSYPPAGGKEGDYVARDDQSCRVMRAGKTAAYLDGCKASDYASLSPNGRDVVSNYNDAGAYIVWDAESGAKKIDLNPKSPAGWSRDGIWQDAPGGRVVITAKGPDQAEELQLWDPRSGALIAVGSGAEFKGAHNIRSGNGLLLFERNDRDEKGNDHFKTVVLELDGASTPAPAAAVVAVKTDVDVLPTAAMKTNPDAFAIIIGVEKYRQAGVPIVDYASRDAKTMAAYLGTMGFDAKNVAVLTDAQAGKVDFDKYFGKWLKNRVGPKSRVFVYYAGHGAPNPTTGAGYLMPYEADPAYLEETAYPVTQLYAELAKLPTKDITVVLDACFSGQGERSLIAKGTRPLVPVQAARGPENAAVIAAASGSQISASDHETRHGLLTYHLLAGLHGDADANNDGKITTSELFAYARPAVERAAKLQNVEQTPTVSGDTGAAGARVWTTLKKP